MGRKGMINDYILSRTGQNGVRKLAFFYPYTFPTGNINSF